MIAATLASRPVVQLLGPTASGKSALAEAAAERFGVDLVSVDSAQVYRGLDIGSAKPERATRERLRYWLLDLCEPEENYSAARFAQDASAAVSEIDRSARRALLVGGTGLYFRAFQQGLSALPAADAELRGQLQARIDAEGSELVHAELSRLDPLAAQRIGVNDHQRLVRALEVIHLTGQPLSAQQMASGARPDRRQDLRIAFAPADRAVVHQRIAQRLDAMFADGFVDEVRALRQRPELTADHPSMRAVGYRQVWQWLQYGGTESDMRQRCLFATRQLAKRQFTWLRGEAGLVWLNAGAPDALRRGLDLIGDFLDRTSNGAAGPVEAPSPVAYD